jgi:GNAT superfamily N-acetyltransferase
MGSEILTMIEPAKIEDAQIIIDVIKQSIKNCTLDHHDDPVIIADWLSNKTAENMRHWIKDSYAFIFKDHQQIVGFILLTKAGTISLNYTLPAFQNKGIGSQLIRHIIQVARENNIETLNVESTLTAKAFYLSHHFECMHDIYENNQLLGYSMKRHLIT